MKLEATLIERGQTPQIDPGIADVRSLPQATIRKIIKECVDSGQFDTTSFLSSRPMISYIPQEAIDYSHTPQEKQGRQTVRYSPAQKTHETLSCYS